MTYNMFGGTLSLTQSINQTCAAGTSFALFSQSTASTSLTTTRRPLYNIIIIIIMYQASIYNSA